MGGRALLLALKMGFSIVTMCNKLCPICCRCPHQYWSVWNFWHSPQPFWSLQLPSPPFKRLAFPYVTRQNTDRRDWWKCEWNPGSSTLSQSLTSEPQFSIIKHLILTVPMSSAAVKIKWDNKYQMLVTVPTHRKPSTNAGCYYYCLSCRDMGHRNVENQIWN